LDYRIEGANPRNQVDGKAALPIEETD